MEITIDFETVRRVAAHELARAREDIAALGPVAALERSQRRHDERLAGAPDADTLACKSGCSWCCHFTVDVRAVEVVRIVELIAQRMTPQEQERVRGEIRRNAALLRELDDVERMQQNIRCAFLSEGKCTVYEARPQTCRNYHATSAAGCQQSFEQPDNLDIDPEFAPLTYQVGGAHVDAFSKALIDAGYDAAVYEMNVALDAAFAQGDVRARFEARLTPFADLPGADAPHEFLDLGDD